ncbi:MAG: DUF5104 domain-containing protein, partial [[Bacteroides] pectinophilus]|nr:DUF5104 domain-containing protein [[Bacteroides] pectinophilus]
MKKMYHKKYAIVIIAVFAIIMSACSKSAEYNQDKNADWDEQEYNVKTLNEIIRCLDEKDEQALINMMSKNIRKEFNVSAQIEQAFSVYGKTEDYGEFNDHGIMSSDVRHGKYTRKVIGAEMKGVKTDSGRIFDIMFGRCVIDKENPGDVGVYKIYLKDREYGHLAIIGPISNSERDTLKRNIDASNGITEEYIDETASIVIRNGKTNEAHVIQNDEESIGKIEQMLQGMSMIPCSEESYDEW